MLLLGLLLLAAIALELAGPQVLRSFIDSVLQDGDAASLRSLALLFLGIAALAQLVSVLETYLAEYVGWTATNQLRADLTAHVLGLDMSYHNAHSPGELIERIDGDVAKLNNFFARLVVQVIGNAVLFLGVLVVLFRTHWLAGAVVGLFSLFSLWLLIRIRNVAAPHWAAGREASAALFGFLEERLAGLEDIRANGATQHTLRSSYALSGELLRKQRHAAVLGVATGSAGTILYSTGGALSLAIGAFLYLRGSVSIGTVFLIFTYTEMLRRPVEQMTRQMQDLQLATASLGRVQELLQVRSLMHDGTNSLAPGPLPVELRNVTFCYDGGEPVLDDVSVDVPAGSVLGVLGRTGSGKTTLSRLILRLYDPAEGEVRVGGTDVRAVRAASLRMAVGVVTQDVQLFHATVRDNLTFFDSSIPDDRVLRVIHELGLGSWYSGLPNGLDSKLESGSRALSAGEAQLLALGRVFLRDPGLVILDEASARLDTATERRLEHAVTRLLDGRTGIIIAHRLSTVMRAGHILVLDGGRVVEYGERAALLADPKSRFSQLLRTERGGILS